MAENENKKALKLFYSYSHEDKNLRAELEKHLKILQHQKVIESWSDCVIDAGEELDKEIDKSLNDADVILLLVSADFIASKYCYGIEMKRALERHDKEEAIVIPIILTDVDWSDAPFRKLKALPEEGKPVWKSSKYARNKAWTQVSKGIKKSIEKLTKKVEQPEAKPIEKEKVEPKEETPAKEKATEIKTTEYSFPEIKASPATNYALSLQNIKMDKISKKDGAPMVLIPAGEFEMGDNDFDNAKVHTVYIDAFYMDVHEVKNEQYRKFMDEEGYKKGLKAPAFWDNEKFNKPDHPVVGVTWNDARAYADWAGKRLPTEAEWEKAARGGLIGKKYPWGDEELTHDRANYSGTGGKDKWEYTSPVGSFDPNGYGLYDMAGNVWEWCADWYEKDYYKVSEKKNPKGPESGDYRVLRGGSWYYYYTSYLRVAYRDASLPIYYSNNVGFRCVSGLPD